MLRAVSFRQPSGTVTKTASAVSVSYFVLSFFALNVLPGEVDCILISTPFSLYFINLMADRSFMLRPSLNAIGKHE